MYYNIMKKEDKSGQAYLISAIILLMVLAAFITIGNYSKKKEFSSLSYMAEEINIESEKVMDYALVSGNWSVVGNYTQKVSESLDKNTRIYFIEDVSNGISCYNWTESEKDEIPKNFCKKGEEQINMSIDKEEKFSFPVYEGKHFYFVIIKESGGEKYIYKNG